MPARVPPLVRRRAFERSGRGAIRQHQPLGPRRPHDRPHPTDPGSCSRRSLRTHASTAPAVKDQAASVAASAAREAKAVASEAAAEAKDVLTDVRQQLRTQAEEQSAKVASLVGDIAAQLRKMAAAGEPGPAKDIVGRRRRPGPADLAAAGRRWARPHPQRRPTARSEPARPVPRWSGAGGLRRRSGGPCRGHRRPEARRHGLERLLRQRRRGSGLGGERTPARSPPAAATAPTPAVLPTGAP